MSGTVTKKRRLSPGKRVPPIMDRRQYRAFMNPTYRDADSTFPEYIEWTPEKIRVTRELFGLTQEEFAIPARVSVQTILAWENDHRVDKSEVGMRKLQNSLNHSLNPIYQAYMDKILPWRTRVSRGTEATEPRLKRMLRLPNGEIREQIGREFRGIMIPMPDCDFIGDQSDWDAFDRYVRSGVKAEKGDFLAE